MWRFSHLYLPALTLIEPRSPTARLPFNSTIHIPTLLRSLDAVILRLINFWRQQNGWL